MNVNEQPQFDQQLSALRSSGGFVELVDWSSVTLRGADRQKFLNNFCTNDVKRLLPGESCESFFLNVKGKIIGHGLATCRDDELVLVGPPGQGASLAAHLDRYVIREDVQVRDSTSERIWLLVAGNAAAKERIQGAAHFDWRLIDAGFCCLTETTKAVRAADEADLVARGLERGQPDVFDVLRIEAGTPWFGIDFDDNNLPQEVGRNAQAISFTKGCYLGQETVARIDALGHVNQRIGGVAFSGLDLPKVGTDLMDDGLKVGHVTSAAFSPTLNRPIGLAMLRRGHDEVGAKLESLLGVCEVVTLPVNRLPAES